MRSVLLVSTLLQLRTGSSYTFTSRGIYKINAAIIRPGHLYFPESSSESKLSASNVISSGDSTIRYKIKAQLRPSHIPQSVI